MKMKVLLVVPSSKGIYGILPTSVQPHIGIGYIAAVSEKIAECRVIDMDGEGIDISSLLKIIESFQPDVIGFTSTTPQCPSVIKMAEMIKQISAAKIIVGGVHATVSCDDFINSKYIDIVIKGEGELTFVELLKCISEKGDLSKVKGILFKKNGKVIINEDRELIHDLDSLPFPAWHLFPKLKYTYPDTLSKNVFPIITSRGCPGRCTFCNTPLIYRGKFRARTAKNVVDEIEFLIKKYNAKEIHIWDDNFVTFKNRVNEIKNEILNRKINIKFAFPNGLRADFLDEEVLYWLKEMGTYSIAIGVESGSEKILNMAKKNIKLQKISEVVRIAKKIGLEVWCFFIIGLPGENHDTIKQTIDFALKLDCDIAKFHILKPYPGSEVYNYLKSQGLLLSHEYERYGIHLPPVHRLPELSEKDIVMYQRLAYKKFYFRPKKIFQQVLRLKTFRRTVLNIKASLGFLLKILLRIK